MKIVDRKFPGAFKVGRGLYLSQEPTPEQLAALACERGAYLTGDSAAQVLLGEELTLPLRLVSRTSLPASHLWTVSRRHRLVYLTRGDLKILYHPLAVADIAKDDRAIRLLASRYGGKRGQRLLDEDLSHVRELPKRTRELINRAAVGAESPLERTVARALREHGVEVKVNHLIGLYRWDLVIPKMKVAIELDGFKFHIQRDVFIHDRWKNNDAVLRGWTTLRYSGSCVKHHLEDVVGQILSAKAPRLSERWHRLFVRQWHWGMHDEMVVLE